MSGETVFVVESSRRRRLLQVGGSHDCDLSAAELLRAVLLARWLPRRHSMKVCDNGADLRQMRCGARSLNIRMIAARRNSKITHAHARGTMCDVHNLWTISMVYKTLGNA